MYKSGLMASLLVLQAVELQKLILAHNSIESLKEDLRNLPQLTVLNVTHNRLSKLPAAIGEWVL
jgi:Leucine-rich repeat (LRR) protein